MLHRVEPIRRAVELLALHQIKTTTTPATRAQQQQACGDGCAVQSDDMALSHCASAVRLYEFAELVRD